MGLFDEFRRAIDALTPAAIDDPVEGTARIVSCSRAPHAATAGTCSLLLVVQAEGVEPYQVEVSEIVRVDRWPAPGQVVPVRVSRADPRTLRVEWDRVPRHEDLAAERAAAIVASMRTGGMPAAVAGADLRVVDLRDGEPAGRADMIRAMERMTGQDLDGDGAIGLAGAASPAPHTDGPGPELSEGMVAQLERLATLHRAGALSADEYTAAKGRVIDGSD
ncbi:MAG: SHOCT domain-containing protein [Thermoleophilia bacterium]|nr:SHOCT domain-containing protein [Thermoleophilia bacterium]